MLKNRGSGKEQTARMKCNAADGLFTLPSTFVCNTWLHRGTIIAAKHWLEVEVLLLSFLHTSV